MFKSDRESASDFALIKRSLDKVLESNLAIDEQYDYHLVLGQLKLPSAINFAKSFMHDPKLYTRVLGGSTGWYGQARQLIQSELDVVLPWIE